MRAHAEGAQAELSFGAVRALESLLAAAAKRGMPWMTAAQVVNAAAANLGLDWNDRDVRDFASASRAVASAPGTPGYALAEALPPEKLAHVAAALMSQGRVMFRRGARLQRIAALKHRTAELLAFADADLAEHIAGGTP